MHKLRLDIDALRVDSLDLPGGDVRAHQDGDRPPFDTVGDIPTCVRSCGPSECPTCDTCQGPNCKDDPPAA